MHVTAPASAASATLAVYTNYADYAVYAAALLLTLVLAAYCTPRSWWRQPNLRAIAITLGGTLLFGQLMSHWLLPASRIGQPAAQTPAEQSSGALTGNASAAAASFQPACCSTGSGAQPFSVHRAINLRRAASVRAERLRTIPAGTLVTPTGNSHGDWWQITACAAGRCDTGWVSSLWLRRSEEDLRGAP